MENDDKLLKIDEIVNRTNASYEVAKNALEESGGDVLEAVILIENQNKSFSTSDAKLKGEQILEEIKKIVKKGNATKLTIKRNDETIVNLPITAGVLGAFLAPFLAAAGVTAALLTKCTVEIQQSDGKIIDVNGKVEEGMDSMKKTAEEGMDNMKRKAEEVKNTVTESAQDIKNTFN